MIIKSQFKPAWWLTTAHAQTLYSTITRHNPAPVDKIERIELPDGDFVDTAWAINGASEKAPLVILLHGLGGSVSSTYVSSFMRACNHQGWRVVLMHFRGASHEPNRLARAYHSGDTADFNFFLKILAAREPDTKKAAIGVSLGGNVLLKWLGEQGPQSLLDAAVAVSVPFELRLVADKMSRGFSRVYQRYLLQRLRKVFILKTRGWQDELPKALQDFEKWSCFWTFDDNVTAPLHGFASVHDYYRQSSSRRYLKTIATPTLIIHSKDDPFMTPEALPRNDELSDCVTLELSAKGGHVGFISGHFPGKPVYWLEQRIPEYLKTIFCPKDNV